MRCVRPEDAKSNPQRRIAPSTWEQLSLLRARDGPALDLLQSEIQIRILSAIPAECFPRVFPRLAATQTKSMPCPHSTPAHRAEIFRPESVHRAQKRAQPVPPVRKPPADAPPSLFDAIARAPLLPSPPCPVPAPSVDRENFCRVQSRWCRDTDARASNFLPRPTSIFFRLANP